MEDEVVAEEHIHLLDSAKQHNDLHCIGCGYRLRFDRAIKKLDKWRDISGLMKSDEEGFLV